METDVQKKKLSPWSEFNEEALKEVEAKREKRRSEMRAQLEKKWSDKKSKDA